METRSFDPGRRAVGELTPIDVRSGTVKDALQALQMGVVQTHGCLEAHIAEQTKHNATQLLAIDAANEKRETMGRDLAEVKGELRGLALALGVRKPEAGEEKPKAKALGRVGVSQAGGLVIAPWMIWGAWYFAHSIWPHVVPAPPALPANPS